MKIVLLYGGKSAEHEVSIDTARSIQKHLNYEKYTVQPVYISYEGKWIAGKEIQAPLDDHLALSLEPGEDSRYVSLNESEHSFGQEVSPVEILKGDVLAFPALHGTNGEDGTIQGLFETLAVPYVGCGVLASAIGMDKISSKRLFQEAQIPQVPFTSLLSYEWKQERANSLDRIEGELVYPLFVKPSNMGSSIGITRVENQEQLVDAIELAFKYDHRLVIEQGVTAREIEVAVKGNDKISTSVPGEILKDKDFYDYDEKYESAEVKLGIPADLPGETVDIIREYARRAYLTIGASGLARADFFLNSNGDVFINELNTFPGFTTRSMYPLLWEGTGLHYEELIQDLIDLGLERYQERQALQVRV